MTARLNLTIQITEDAYHRLCARARESKQSPQERAADELSGRAFAVSLTRLAAALLEFIDKQHAETRVAPSYGEMARHLGCSKSGIHRLILQLEARGAIRRLPYRSRALEIVRAAA